MKAKHPQIEVIFIGSTSVEEELASRLGIPYYHLNMKGLPRKFSIGLFSFFLKTIAATIKAIVMLKKLKVGAVFASGGYVSFPAAAAAVLLRKKLFLHEQNATLGLVNRIFARWATILFESLPVHENQKRAARTVFTGNPLRGGVIGWKRGKGIEFFGLDPTRKTILIFGGSQGARKINETTFELVRLIDESEMSTNVQVLHVLGKRDYMESLSRAKNVKKLLKNIRYHFLEYIHEMGAAYAAADLVVSRAGATTLAEITANSKPSILIPYPYATDNHQRKNAEFLLNKGAALLISDEELDAQTLAKKIIQILSDGSLLTNMAKKAGEQGKPNADDEISSYIISELKFS